ncbi:hydroxyphenylacetyl-CoA thioesterase PaaI [Psychromarinibacter sp. C21-152]|uniref:Hydroxyphenylacetyl-CoA thioesterase PaaI n=1 Tax=Psychromarinibacter sediminicola TaxID=3033385 RepID=A0AAE3NXQ4_9RHOB|nr:hydroxyphenylacetyl-CoA thioesterase PaaI [Psychromarinibacter sediminicola]MDF0602880.1 hydroxyphenylacetyl-CoA thioesterase PaaI [Psychromarinibacter sediminicola]
MIPEEIAEKSAAAMWARDDASRWVGMELVEVAPGRAVTALTVAAHHTNGQDICHGGVIFSLADSAFAFACNSYNKTAVAQHNMISFIAPGMTGDRLTAEAREVSLRGRSGIYDVRVTRDDGALIAEMRGCSRIIPGTHFDLTDADET